MDVFEYRRQMRVAASVDEGVELLATQAIGAAIEVHKELGPGMPERCYLMALCHELTLRDIPFEYEWAVPIVYKGLNVGDGRIDILVAGKLVLELKAVDAIAPVHKSQCLKYLRLLNLQLGLVINFNVERLADGIKRVVNSKRPSPA